MVASEERDEAFNVVLLSYGFPDMLYDPLSTRCAQTRSAQRGARRLVPQTKRARPCRPRRAEAQLQVVGVGRFLLPPLPDRFSTSFAPWRVVDAMLVPMYTRFNRVLGFRFFLLCHQGFPFAFQYTIALIREVNVRRLRQAAPQSPARRRANRIAYTHVKVVRLND